MFQIFSVLRERGTRSSSACTPNYFQLYYTIPKAFSKLDRKAGIEKIVYLAFLSPEKKSLMGENHESGLTRLKTH